MGLFGNLFSKKECNICGNEIGLLGNRKLEDGNLCKECAKKLSPWFDDRRHSTVEQIREQLTYREENQKKVADFRTTRTLGEDTRVMFDEDAGLFMVVTTDNYRTENPDVLAFSDVTGCNLDIEEDTTELTRENKDGEEVSYNPPRYVHEYDFYLTVYVHNPYFDDMRFKLNSSTVTMEETAGRSQSVGGNTLAARLGAAQNVVSQFNPEHNASYRQYKEMGEEIKAVLLQIRQQVRDEKAAATAPKASVTCPFCGATTVPDERGACEYCGSNLA